MDCSTACLMLPCSSRTPGACSNSCPSSQSVMSSKHLTLCRPFLLPPSIFPSINVFSSESVLHIRWLNIGVSASASVLPVSIPDWLPLGYTDWISLHSKELCILQHHSSKASILQHLAFSIVQLLHPYMTIGKPITFTIWNFVGKVMSFLFNMLSRLIIAFLPRSKRLLISWL